MGDKVWVGRGLLCALGFSHQVFGGVQLPVLEAPLENPQQLPLLEPCSLKVSVMAPYHLLSPRAPKLSPYRH